MLSDQERLQVDVLKMYGQREGELRPLGQTFVQAARAAAQKAADEKIAAVDAEVFELISYSKKV